MLFHEERFGIFIHWGLYAIPAWHEQMQWLRNIPKDDYVVLMEQFNPVDFDPDDWAEKIKKSGAQYVCFTAKHHDGFCMWDTKFTNYNIMNTPYKKDILKLISDSCRKAGLGFSIYYSVPDWNHPNSVNYGGDHQLKEPNVGDVPDDDKYIEYVVNQITELCSNYGKLESFFWDIPPKKYKPSINKLIRKLQPGILINDRGYDKGDFSTPERNIPKSKEFVHLTEACDSIGERSWGYRENEDYYSYLRLTQKIDAIMAMGGNYLLNVGPDASGVFPEYADNALIHIGGWFNRVREALFAKPISRIVDTDKYLLTYSNNTLYVHFPYGCESTGVVIPHINTSCIEATVLNNNKKLSSNVDILPFYGYSANALHISGIPVNDIHDETVVLKLVFESQDDFIPSMH